MINKPNPTQLDEQFGLIDEVDYAAFLKKTLPSLRNDRSAGKGPPYVKIGNKVWYRRADVLAFVSASLVQPRPAPTMINGRPARRRAHTTNK